MDRDTAIAIIEHLAGKTQRPGSTTSRYHGHNALSNFIVKESPHTLAAAKKWKVQALFIANDDILKSHKHHLWVIYKMGCGTLLALSFRTPASGDASKVLFPKDFDVVEKNTVLQSEIGFKVPLTNWFKAGDMSELVLKKGPQKKRHLARKPAGV